MRIKTVDKIYDVLVKSGYSFHFTDEDGFIKQIDKNKRFHIILTGDNTGDMHIDKTVNGKHKLLFAPEMMGSEKTRIKKFDSKLILSPSKKDYIKYASNLSSLQKRIVIKRCWFNPLRYIIGKFKYIK